MALSDALSEQAARRLLPEELSQFCEPYSHWTSEELAEHFLNKKLPASIDVPLANEENLARARDALDDCFTYIGETHKLDPLRRWVLNPSADKEWIIAHHKHYFSVDLCLAWEATGDRAFLVHWSVLMADWLDCMASGYVTTSDAQVEAKRVESWIFSISILHRCGRTMSPEAALVLPRMISRLASEADYISRNLKPARNHRTFQLFAVYLAGAMFPELAFSRELSATAHALLTQNLMQDFLDGGVHIERSTHYHNLALETGLSFVSIARQVGEPEPAELRSRLRKALEFSVAFLMPDGEIPLIGDSDNLDHRGMFRLGYELFGDAPCLWAATHGQAGSPPAPSRLYDGYMILTDLRAQGGAEFSKRQHAFFDFAPLGEGSHSHFDLFSFCWSAQGQQIVVDPGRYTYLAEPDAGGIDWRYEFKRTRSHNTVEIDGLDQTRYLSKAKHPARGHLKYDRSIHLAKHGTPPQIIGGGCMIGSRSDWIAASAVSSEYVPRHSRAVFFHNREYLCILDHIDVSDGAEHTACSRLHLAPALQNAYDKEITPASMTVSGSTWTIHMLSDRPAAFEVEEGWHAKTYGEKLRNDVLCHRLSLASEAQLACLLVPRESAGRSIALKGVRWRCETASRAKLLEVEILVDGEERRDVFMYHPKGGGYLNECAFSYSGVLAACRMSGNMLSSAYGWDMQLGPRAAECLTDGAGFEI